MMHKLEIKLAEAKQAIAIPDFKRDDLLRLALTDLSTLQLPSVSEQERQDIVLQYRRLAFLGDRLLDAVVADYYFTNCSPLSNQDLDDSRQYTTSRESLAQFAISLGLPNFCSSWNKPSRKLPQDEPGVYGEMFEVLIAVIYLDSDRDFQKVYDWFCDRFILETTRKSEEDFEFDEDCDLSISDEDYLDMIGLRGFPGSWVPGDDDD
ncbi:ribonuclease III domain-containing protein [Leptolyngbya sp. GGD]|uniref:ribonuclease III domain-containing protein n=1 Tax=Leptolyngbya sp. GGD TaxID=2997907 RepID=UPI00227CA377|nr:ribonuclease III domain-containing protein [Leptolyngbya sp. GGD]MCY6492304.1 ribonuclease III domain-containing protein [Leptolyngbya sp. GGD]